MPVQQSDIRIYASAGVPLTDTATPVGGAIDRTTELLFSNLTALDNLQAVSSSQADNTQEVTITGRNSAGAITTETINLAGRTPVPCVNTTSWFSILLAQKLASCTGDIAIEGLAALFVGAATGTVSTQTLTLTTPPSAVDLTACVLRITTGTGLGYVAVILSYNTSTGICYLNTVPPTVDNTSIIRISRGMVFRQVADGGTEIMKVRRPFYNAVAPAPLSPSKSILEKVFLMNTNGTQSMGSVQLQQALESGISLSLGVDAALNSNTVAAGPRTGASPVPMFTGTPVPIPGSTLAPGQSIGTWLQLNLGAGVSPIEQPLSLQIQGI